jgi:hypothetical protein
MLRDISDKALAAGILPLEVLLKHMRYYDGKADLAEKMFHEALAKEDATMAEKIEKLSKMFNMKVEACKLAVEAAPYCHSRRASITVEKNSTHTEILMELKAPATQEENRAYRTDGNVITISRPGS